LPNVGEIARRSVEVIGVELTGLTIGGDDHVVHLEQPAAVNQRIMEVLG
jgi:hypothetical protein